MAFKMICNYEFIVENNNCVVCYATPTWVDKTTASINAIATHIEAYTNMPQAEYPLFQRFKGVAIRKSDDNVDIELARDIARKKAMRAAAKAFRAYIYRAEEVIGDYWSRIAWAELAAENRVYEIDGEIEELAEG